MQFLHIQGFLYQNLIPGKFVVGRAPSKDSSKPSKPRAYLLGKDFIPNNEVFAIKQLSLL